MSYCCDSCDQERRNALWEAGDFYGALASIFYVCPECGNKRCPRANHHDNACTNSNEPGQPGSGYPPLSEIQPVCILCEQPWRGTVESRDFVCPSCRKEAQL